MATIIAKTMDGREFMYSRQNSYSAPKSSANQIAAIINDIRWKIQPGEKWHVYEIGDWELDYMAAGYQRLSIRNGSVSAHYIQ